LMAVKTMLSRNFYECEEVCLALLDSLRRGRSKEAIYWAYELQLSQEHELLEKTIIRAWILYLGPPNIHWLDAWFASAEADMKLALISVFASLYPIKKKKVSSMLKTFYITGRGFSEVQDLERINMGVESNDPFSVYWWLGPGYEKSPTALLEFIAGFVDSAELFDSLRKAMASIGSLQMKNLLGAAAVQLLCLSSYPDSYVVDDGGLKDINSYKEEWDLDYGKKRRHYPILESMLPHGGGRVTQNIGLNIGWREILTTGCVFWKRQMERIVDDDSQETVYAELFPDDIPDEWGLEPKSISHPVKSDSYKIYTKQSYRMKLVWGFSPVLRKTWDSRLKSLFKVALVPDK